MKCLILLVLGVIYSFSSVGQQTAKHCKDFDVRVEISEMDQSTEKSLVKVNVSGENSEMKYFFMTEDKTKVLSTDFKNDNLNLERGKYVCLVVTKSGCSKEIKINVN